MAEEFDPFAGIDEEGPFEDEPQLSSGNALGGFDYDLQLPPAAQEPTPVEASAPHELSDDEIAARVQTGALGGEDEQQLDDDFTAALAGDAEPAPRLMPPESAPPPPDDAHGEALKPDVEPEPARRRTRTPRAVSRQAKGKKARAYIFLDEGELDSGRKFWFELIKDGELVEVQATTPSAAIYALWKMLGKPEDGITYRVQMKDDWVTRTVSVEEVERTPIRKAVIR